MNHEPEKGVTNSYWMVTMVLDPSYGLGKKELMDKLRDRAISNTRPFFFPLSDIPAYSEKEEQARERAQEKSCSL